MLADISGYFCRDPSILLRSAGRRGRPERNTRVPTWRKFSSICGRVKGIFFGLTRSVWRFGVCFAAKRNFRRTEMFVRRTDRDTDERFLREIQKSDRDRPRGPDSYHSIPDCIILYLSLDWNVEDPFNGCRGACRAWALGPCARPGGPGAPAPVIRISRARSEAPPSVCTSFGVRVKHVNEEYTASEWS